MTYKLVIPGAPVGKERARISPYCVYTPAKTKNYETLVQELFLSAHGFPMLNGEISAHIKAFYGLNKADYGKYGLSARGRKKLSGEIRPTKKPDADNIAKILLDSLNSIAYKDDSQVVRLVVEKHYSEQPRVELEIAKLEDI